MVRADADWKNEQRRGPNWAVVALAAVLVALYAAVWLRTGEQEPLALGVVLAAWTALYFTPYWQPILYLVAATVFGGSVAVDLVTGIPDVPFYWLVAATTVAFVAVTIVLFVTEEAYS